MLSRPVCWLLPPKRLWIRVSEWRQRGTLRLRYPQCEVCEKCERFMPRSVTYTILSPPPLEGG